MNNTRPLEQIDYPQNREEWWLLVEHHKNNLLQLVDRFHPANNRCNLYKITAPLAEVACEQIRQEIKEQTEKTPSESFQLFMDQKDPELVSLLNETWFGMPESYDVQGYPGFGTLCDLCSEAYVLEEESDYT